MKYIIKQAKEHLERHSHILGSIVLGIVLTVLVVNGLEASARAKFLATQESLSEEVLRFHVLANSDSDEDQALKLLVKDHVIDYMSKSLGDEDSVVVTKVWAENNIDNIKALCQEVIENQGYEYCVDVTMEEAYFPVKTYGDITFPEGEYEALRVKIGEAAGQNWWCCLYPNLCFIDATHGIVSEEGKENLQEVLTVDEYDMITTTTECKVKWFFFSW